MTFTDDDLKRLKDAQEGAKTQEMRVVTMHGIESFDLKALLARLDIAEICIEHLRSGECGEFCVAYEDWRKAAGK